MLLPEPTPKKTAIKSLTELQRDLNYQSFLKVQLHLVKLSTINGLPGLSSSVLQLYLTLLCANSHCCYNKQPVWWTLTKSRTSTCAKTKPENLSSHVTTRHINGAGLWDCYKLTKSDCPITQRMINRRRRSTLDRERFYTFYCRLSSHFEVDVGNPRATRRRWVLIEGSGKDSRIHRVDILGLSRKQWRTKTCRRNL